MAVTEHDLRRYLDGLAGQAAPPRFSVAELAARIRRRRARNARLASACVAAAAALAVGVPLGLASGTGRGHSSYPGVESVPAPRLRNLRFMPTVDGRRPSVPPHRTPSGCGKTPANPCPGTPEAGFSVSPGQHLSIRVVVTIPAGARLTDLWLGVTPGTLGTDRSGRPVGQLPILAHIRADLEPGRHTYQLAWTVPALGPSHAVLVLAASWSGRLPTAGQPGRRTSASVTTAITAFYVSRR